ncbi:DUF4383 domain-containing protein [Actinomadura rudentiformis]|uniref:DUF4383 domain-containing protein n=1 Tax=Actinomadura rudentiformis TaxID=359158 RepID=A0A6H9ZAM2_9ACTN|nr:DUF4383 domain-containing protein [Actinomadura rudentiformis]KAB2352533.1 DUF4383 domain-containing protein [Actinomadura rudentiformis]
MNRVTGTKRTISARPLVCLAALTVGAVFLLVGVLGFIPGITTDYDTMKFAGHESDAKLMGLFDVSILHNIVHLLFGVAGVVMARQARTAQWYLLGGGVIYLILWLYGLVIDKDHSANFVPVNAADDWLHFVLGAGMIALGLVLSRRVPKRERVV